MPTFRRCSPTGSVLRLLTLTLSLSITLTIILNLTLTITITLALTLALTLPRRHLIHRLQRLSPCPPPPSTPNPFKRVLRIFRRRNAPCSAEEKRLPPGARHLRSGHYLFVVHHREECGQLQHSGQDGAHFGVGLWTGRGRVCGVNRLVLVIKRPSAVGGWL